VTVRFAMMERMDLDDQRRARGGLTRSAYIRMLVRQDGARLKKERGD